MKNFEGKTLQNKYFLQEYIGGGGFGAVFKSQQYFLDVPTRRVAVKISKHTGFDVNRAKEIFADVFMLAEAMDEMTDSEARSPQIHIYNSGILPEENNRLFVVMEYVQGTSLAHHFKSFNRVSADILLKWIRQICQALRGLHRLVPPLVHRDLKPDNILLGIDQNVRVVDFGLAARLMKNGYVPGTAGTVQYLAPETVSGETVPASDVYTIGLLLYEGLTGKLPFGHIVPPLDIPDEFQGEWLNKQKSIVRPTPPSSLNNTVTPQLDAIVLRCLEFNPVNRFLNAGELLKTLDGMHTPKPPDLAALEEGLRLRDSGELKGAILRFERGLAAPSSFRETRFRLLRELGRTLMSVGEYRSAATNLVSAWELTRESTILRSREERAELLREIANAFQKSNNTYQAEKFQRLAQEELKAR